MKVQFLGTRMMSFRTTEGRDMTGTKVYYAYEDKEVNGQAADSFFADQDKFGLLTDIVPGSHGSLDFNQRGKVQDIIYGE